MDEITPIVSFLLGGGGGGVISFTGPSLEGAKRLEWGGGGSPLLLKGAFVCLN